MAEKPDIRALVDVEGGASIDGKSAQRIAKTLEKIAKNISAQKRPHITFDVDIQNTTKKVYKQLNEIVKSIKVEPIDLQIRTNQSSIGTLNGNAKSNVSVLSEEKQALADLAVQKLKDAEVTKKQESAVSSFLAEAKQLKNAEKSLNTSDNFASKLGKNDLLARLPQLRDEAGALNREVDALLEATNGGKTLGEHVDSDNFKRLAARLKEVNNEILNIQRSATKDNPLFTKNERVAKQARDVSDFSLSLEKYAKANDKFKNNAGAASEFERIKNALADIQRKNGIGEDISIDLDELKKKTNDWKSSLQSAGLTGQTAFGRLRAQMEKLGVYFGASAIMMGAWRQAKNIINNVVELDTKVTDLQIATGNSRQETEKLIRTYSEMGKQLGATTVDVANAADAWLRQGYSVAESNTLIKNSMMLSKLGQIDSAEATKALTSAMKGYKLSVEESAGVVDKFTSLDMDAAVSAGFIATAMSETATGARLAGIEMDRLAGYITTVGEVTQDGAESVGTFYRTLFARMGNIKVGRFVDDETGESLSDVESVLSKLGIALRDGEKNFRNFGVVLDETWDKWDTFSQVDQNAIAVAFSGTRQQEKFKTLMDNYGQAMDYAKTAATSAGTALDKYENSYLVSAQAAQDRFTAQFELLSKTVLESGLINDTYDAGTGFLGILTGIVDNLGIIPTLATVAAGALSSIGNRGKPVKQNSDGVRNYLMALKIYAHPLRKVA